MARPPQRRPAPQPPPTTEKVRSILASIKYDALWRGLGLLFLAAAYSPIAHLTLSPVYGSTASSFSHRPGMLAAGICGYFLKDRIQRLLGRRAAHLIPVLAFWIPTIQFFLFKLSSSLGNPAGPVVTDLFTYYPLLLLSVAVSVKIVQYALDLRTNFGELAEEHVPFVGSYVLFIIGEKVANFFIMRFIGTTTRCGFQLLIAALYSVTVPSKLLLLALPSLLFSFTANVHMPFSHTTAVLNSALQEHGYTLLDRRESVTGYISILESEKQGFRAMRCDHSLLGGEWNTVGRNYHPAVKDPIYAVFAMLEAVRLVKPEEGEHRRPDEESNALVIGLGIGTTPGALIMHGIDTTIVEIDPVVYQLAREYFHLPANHTAVIEDAVKFVKKATSKPVPPKYDYIVHDVFTGGAEPIELFTVEFLEGLKSLLKNDGVIAINYAGDISLYPAKLVSRTVRAVFPTCRIFREDPASENPKHKRDDNSETPDFTNMVIFCKKTTASPLEFRPPTAQDFLGSKAREAYMLPRHEIDPAVFDRVGKGEKRILRARDAPDIHTFLTRSAVEHWEIMRTVLPREVWENW